MLELGHTCFSVFGKVANGAYFTPVGQDICRKCKCLAGKAVGCINETCPGLPNCARYEQVDGKCCEFKCLDGDGLSNKSELAVILSLSIGFVLLLVILITILYCRRKSAKKGKEQELSEIKTQSSIEQVQPNTVSDTQPNNAATSEVNQEERPRQAEIELPPPYFPPENLANVNQKRTRQALPPNEPPPPYDREESSV